MMGELLDDPLYFLAQLRAAIKDKSFAPDPVGRACVITRSPANYGQLGGVLIEWEGSPPRSCIYYGNGVLVMHNKKVKLADPHKVFSIIDAFLKAHPANADDSPVWVGHR